MELSLPKYTYTKKNNQTKQTDKPHTQELQLFGRAGVKGAMKSNGGKYENITVTAICLT